jgi:ribosomal protein S18 acetylase RimI-like enzyme
MTVEITEEHPHFLAEYARISIAFEVRSVYEVAAAAGGLGGLVLVERGVATPWVKDYDALPGGSPLAWPDRFDVSRWGLLAARAPGGKVVGAAAVAHDAPDLELLLRGRSDVAVLFDLRVAPEARGRGVGTALLAAAEAWSAARRARRLMIETQNVNAAACRFYARRGCVLGGIDRFAYPALPEETQLLWYKALAPPRRRPPARRRRA